MNVGLAKAIFSRSVSDGLRYLVQYEGYDEDMLTTAKFIEYISRWFDLVNSRFHDIGENHVYKKVFYFYNSISENIRRKLTT